MDVSVQERRRAFTHWLRTGRLPLSRAPDGLELKFNPYHDPRNGQFTFAPGGPAGSRGAEYVRPPDARPVVSGTGTGTGKRTSGTSIIKDGVARHRRSLTRRDLRPDQPQSVAAAATVVDSKTR